MKAKSFPGLLLAVIIMGACITLLFPESGHTQSDASSLIFRWAFIRLKNDSELEFLDFDKKGSLHSGEHLRIYLYPEQNVYIYLYLLDSEGKLSLLYPSSFGYFETGYRMKRGCYLPGEDHWFVLDEAAGVETFYLLASEKRLQQLEKLTLDYLKAKKQKKLSLKTDILYEIKRLKKQYSRFKIAAEKPVPIAGSMRGKAKEMERHAYLVEAQGFYGKTIRLEHE